MEVGASSDSDDESDVASSESSCEARGSRLGRGRTVGVERDEGGSGGSGDEGGGGTELFFVLAHGFQLFFDAGV